MSRPTAPIRLEEMPGQTYPDLQTAQKAALAATAHDLAATIRKLLEAGRLANVNGKIIPVRS